MEDDIQLTPSPEAPDANSVQPDPNAAADTDSGGDRIFDITDDLNIAPAKDVPVRTFPLKSAQIFIKPIQNKPLNPAPEPNPDFFPKVPSAPAEPIQASAPAPSAPIQPHKPAPIPFTDFSASLEKAKTIGSANPSFADFGKITKLPTQLGKDPVTQSASLKPLRTYEGDVAEVLAHTKASSASIAIAEAKKQQGQEQLGNNGNETEEPSHAGKKLILGLLSLILVGGGIIGAYYFYSRSPLAEVTPQKPTAQAPVSLIPTDDQEVLPLSGSSQQAILSRIRTEVAKGGTPNSITEIIPTQTTNGQDARISAQDMLSLMQIAPPDVLARSLQQDWMLGLYADPNGSRSAFVIVTTNFFQNAFAGMLQWESVMADDLKQYLIPGDSQGIANVPAQSAGPAAVATSTGSMGSTTPVTSPSVPSSTFYSVQGHFMDRIITNKDVRAFQTSDGRTLFLYSFVDNNKLVIAGNEKALTEIIARLEKRAFIR